MKQVTVRRWEIVSAFVVLIISFVVMGAYLKNDIDNNGVALTELKQHAATIAELKKTNIRLEKTNCRTRKFLLSSVRVRQRLVEGDKKGSIKQRRDKQAVKISIQLANSFANELCSKQLDGNIGG